ncbi:ubiquitin thiolesterase [Ilyonectria robusta]
MAGFFNKIKGSGTASSTPSKDALAKKKEEPVLDLTPLEKMLQNAPPLRDDGTDRFFGLENVRLIHLPPVQSSSPEHR